MIFFPPFSLYYSSTVHLLIMSFIHLLMRTHCWALWKGLLICFSECTVNTSLTVMLTKAPHWTIVQTFRIKWVFFPASFHPSLLSWQVGPEWPQFFINWNMDDESCVTHSLPQVGVDNLDKHAHSFVPIFPLSMSEGMWWPEVSNNKWAAGNNLSLWVMSGALCVTVRPGLSALHVNCRQSSMWSSVLQCPARAHQHHTDARELPDGCIHAALQLSSDICVHPKAWLLMTAAESSRWERSTFFF